MYACVSIYVFVHDSVVPTAARRQHPSDALEVELKVIVSHLMWVLGTELGSSAGAVCILSN